jgi:uncharacterized protein (TIGR02145 family)
MNRIARLFVLSLLMSGTAVAQFTRVSFSAADRHTAAPVQLDSVRVENLSTMRDTVITEPLVIDIKIPTGLRERLSGLVHSLEISGNFANPFTDATSFTVTTTSRGNVQLELFSIAGRREADLNAELEAGAHQFSLKAASLPAGVYLLVARTGQSTSSVRIVKSAAAGGGSPALYYTGSSAGPGPSGFGKASAAMYRFTGYADTYHPEAIEAAPIGDTAIVFAMRRIQIAPVIDRFVCLNPVSFPGDTTVFEITASSALQSLSRILIDFESDGVMDDSVSASGGGAQATFRHAYTAAGMYNARACVTDLYGNTSCKDLDSTVTVRDPLPVLTTAPLTEIRPTSARSGGSISSEGNSPVTARGVCWSTTHGPSIADDKTIDGTGIGVFASRITGLTEKTTYYLRAYATNSAGTAYGNELSFRTADPNDFLPVLSTDTVTAITMTTAICGGAITSDGGFAVTARGVCWSTSAQPTTADNKTGDGRGSGRFTSNITGLTENTTYYLRAYATNSAGTAYGNELSFRTADPGDFLPVLSTDTVTAITMTTAICGGHITSDGGFAVTARGVCWSTSAQPTTEDNKTSDGTGSGRFTSDITGLTENTTYYIRAYAINNVGTGYGGTVEFSTTDPADFLPVLTTDTVTAITMSTARSGGQISSDGGYPVTLRGVCWSSSPAPTIADDKTDDGAGTGSFESSITGLTDNTTYYVRAYAANIAGIAYGNEVSFTTIEMSMYLPVLTTAAISDITVSTAKSGGNITSSGGYPVTARGVCWGTSPAPTTADSKTADGVGIGLFSSNLTGLATNTTYYVRAYATNSVGTGYGNEVSFTATDLSAFSPVVTTTTVTDITTTTARSGGTIISNGGYPVTARGVCWSMWPNPTTSNSKTVDGAGTGSFLSNVSGLVANTTYYLRAYATNSAGTGYGNEEIFTAQHGGGDYATVTIGTQVWMQRNLNVDRYRNGDPIPHVSDPAQWAGLTTGAWCYYNNDQAMGAIYGKLYNWYAVNDPRGLAPAGWHVPSDEEWKTLAIALGMSQSEADQNGFRGTDEGGKLKEDSTAHWFAPNMGATNSSGFTALPASYRYTDGTFSTSMGDQGYWWSSSEYSTAGARNRGLFSKEAGVLRTWYYKHSGISVRCIRD